MNTSPDSSPTTGIGDDFKDMIPRQASPDVTVALEKLKTFQPKLEFYIAYSRHATEEDAQFLKEGLSNCDIFVPEGYGWMPGTEENFDKVSHGVINPNNLFTGLILRMGGNPEDREYEIGRLKSLYATQAKTLIIDLPNKHPLTALINQLDEKADIGTDDFEKTLDFLKDYIITSAHLQSSREDYMIQQLPRRLEELTRQYPDLASKNSLRLFFSLGAYHTRFYQLLKSVSPDATRVMQEPTTIYDFTTEAMKRAVYGKDLDQTLLANIMLEALVDVAFPKVRSELSVTNHSKFIRNFASTLTQAEKQQLYEVTRQAKEPHKIRSILIEEFKEKQIQVPLGI